MRSRARPGVRTVILRAARGRRRSRRRRRRKIATMIARPTATSAAATDQREEHDHLAADVVERVGERDEREVHRVEHQLDAHEHHDHVAADEHADRADREEHRGEDAGSRFGDRRRRRASRVASDRLAASSARAVTSRSLPAAPGEHDGADDRDHEQHRGDLERPEEVGEQRRARRARCCRRGRRRSSGTPLRGLLRRWPTRGRRGTDLGQQRSTPSAIARAAGPASDRRSDSLLVDAEQHDHEQEQHDDRAGVDDHLHRRDSSASWSRNSTATLTSVMTSNSAECTGLRASTTPSAPASASAPTTKKRNGRSQCRVRVRRCGRLRRRRTSRATVADWPSSGARTPNPSSPDQRDPALVRGLARRRGGAHPRAGVVVLAAEPQLPRLAPGAAVVVDEQLVLRVDRVARGW